MFALEINFQDGVSQPEMILIRRPQALIGSSDYAHVVVDDMKDLNFQVRLMRDVGRRFRCKPVVNRADVSVPDFLEGVYDGFASINPGAACSGGAWVPPLSSRTWCAVEASSLSGFDIVR